MKKIFTSHWKFIIVAAIAVVIAMVGAALVLIWYVETSDIGLQGTATFDQWSMAWVVTFMIKLSLWELLIVGLPSLLIMGSGGFLWWTGLSDLQKLEFKKDEKKSKIAKAGNIGGGGFFFNVAYLIYIFLEGNFNTPFGDLPYSYWLYAYLQTFVWLLIIVGIPVILVGTVIFLAWYRKSK